MNAPAKFESLLWLASPMLAWSQATGEPTPGKAGPAKTAVVQPSPVARTRRKRRKSLA